jgi:hypothetical protein
MVAGASLPLAGLSLPTGATSRSVKTHNGNKCLLVPRPVSWLSSAAVRARVDGYPAMSAGGLINPRLSSVTKASSRRTKAL